MMNHHSLNVINLLLREMILIVITRSTLTFFYQPQ